MDSLDRLKKRFASYTSTDDQEKSLKKLLDDLPVQSQEQQLKTLHQIAQIISRKCDLEIALVWSQIEKYLNNPSLNAACFDCMHSIIGAHFLIAVSHYDEVDILRKSFFNIISTANISSIKILIPILSSLSKSGKDIRHFEYEFGNLQVRWFQQICINY